MGSMRIGFKRDIRILILKFQRMPVPTTNMEANPQAIFGVYLIIKLGNAIRKVIRIRL